MKTNKQTLYESKHIPFSRILSEEGERTEGIKEKTETLSKLKATNSNKLKHLSGILLVMWKQSISFHL